MFYSILFPTKQQHERLRRTEAPACMGDLNLGQIFTPILEDKKEYELESFFYTSLKNPEIITYRQEIMRDLEDSALRDLLAGFSKTLFDLDRHMSAIRNDLSSDDRYNYLTKGKMLDCADRYCGAVSGLSKGLSSLNPCSAGLRGFSDYLENYRASKAFTNLRARAAKLRDGFSTVKYCMLIKNGVIRVRKYENQADHAQQILACFEKFRKGDVKDYRHKLSEEPVASHVEAAVLKLLAGLYKDVFNDLNDFCAEYLQFVDEIISQFVREIQFYLSWLEFINPLRQAGLPFCYPEICDVPERLYTIEMFDLALAGIKRNQTVANDFSMKKPEHVIVVTGPNQGGKTTFARAFGQIHYLMSLGLCVPGKEAALYLFDNILTHFGREEDLSAQNGKLRDDLVRLRALLDAATGMSIIIVNEIFASTTLNDALILGKRMMDAFAALGAPAMIVTFLDELASHAPETVSMMSTVKEEDPSRRTFKILRKPPDGLAYALHIAQRHGLTYDQLRGRLGG